MREDPMLEVEAKTKVIQPPSTTRGGALGTLIAPPTRPRRRDDRSAGSRRQASTSASLADLALGAACWPGTLKAGGRLKAGGGCFPGGFTALVDGILKSHHQEGKEHSSTYSSMDVLPLFQRPKGATATAWGPLPLAERFEVHKESAEALDVATSTGRIW